jgi:hypothetical protein
VRPSPPESRSAAATDDLVLRPALVVRGRLRHTDLVRDHLQRGAANAVRPNSSNAAAITRVCAAHCFGAAEGYVNAASDR